MTVSFDQKSPNRRCRLDLVSRAWIRNKKKLRLETESDILQNPKIEYILASEGAQLFPHSDKYDGGQVERGVAGKGK